MRFFSRFLGGDDSPADTAAPDLARAQGQAPGAVPGPDEAGEGTLGETAGPGWNFGALAAPPVESPPAAPTMAVDPAVTAELKPKVVEVLKTVFDPEIPVDIYELGLIYDIQADADRRVHVNMTLTSPACPSAQQLPSEVRYKVKAIAGVSDATVAVVWEPPWTKERMSDVAKLHLGFF